MKKLTLLALTAVAVPLLCLSACGVPTDVDDPGASQSQALTADGGFVFDAGAGCQIDESKELMIRDLSVVEDPVRTVWPADAGADAGTGTAVGAWTFGKLMTDMAGPNDPADFTENLFKQWLVPQTINGFTVAPRPTMQTVLLNKWPRLANGKLDLHQSPLRLLAISARVDLRQLSAKNAGEGRFIFGVLDATTRAPLQFTVILEYKLRATTAAQTTRWANAWHSLGSFALPSAEYNAQLQRITDNFAGANLMPAKPNGSALGQLRTNEVALSGVWELRQFVIGSTGQLVEVSNSQTPADSINNTATFGAWVNQNEAAILAGTAQVPVSFNRAPFLGSSAQYFPSTFWDTAFGQNPITNPDARHLVSLNACSGCHGAETSTVFLHVAPRAQGVRSNLSGFLTGINVVDPAPRGNFKLRTFNDLDRRAADLASLTCAPSAAPSFEASSARAH